MASLDRALRRDLENAVKVARRVAENGARQALEQLAVGHQEPWPTLNPNERKLRNRLRAHGRQLGDRLDERKGTQALEQLVAECAYEQWHRMLFARFLAENDLLIEPESGVALSMNELQQWARERHPGKPWMQLAGEFAQRMLPAIFRSDDPVLAISFAPEALQKLEETLAALPREVFVADDALGWVYQYWQADTKKAVNEREKKIGAAELPAVTQLFTEDYMVLFLLENTLGAWWASRVLAANPEFAANAADEAALRKATSPPGYAFTYLRFVREGAGPWRTAAGDFHGWPQRAAELRVLDPCMGSGHFLVFALPILAAFRRAEEQLPPAEAVRAVLRDNLFGLELDARCTQLAAFNLALAAWRAAGHQELPPLQLACSGLGVNASEEDWKALGGDEHNLRIALGWLYPQFRDAATLGSLVNPAKSGATKIVEWSDLLAALRHAVAREASEEAHELGVRAFGVAQAAEILASRFTLVATNVPYLGRGKQDERLKSYCEGAHPAAKADLATCFVERCLAFCATGGTAALVTPQNWLFLDTYKSLRKQLLENEEWSVVARLGPRAFETISGEVVNVALLALSAHCAAEAHAFAGLDVSEPTTPAAKAELLRTGEIACVEQKAQLMNPDGRVQVSSRVGTSLLSSLARAAHGHGSFDSSRFSGLFVERPAIRSGWVAQQSTPAVTGHYGGCHFSFRWEDGSGALAELMRLKELGGYTTGKWKAGVGLRGCRGILVGQMRDLPSTIFLGTAFDENASVVVPHNEGHIAAIWCFLASNEGQAAIREIDQSIKVTCGSLVKVPFDLDHWQRVAAEKYPHGLPKPHSDDPTQWLFSGHPCGADHPLQVAVARLTGYRWPRQTGSSFPDCPALGEDGLERFADDDGIVCLAPLRGEPSATDRLRELLAAAYGDAWSADTLAEALAREGSPGASLEVWLRDEFFAQHCALFHQRPFVWHVWDGQSRGFSALVNCHKLARPNGEGRRTLEKLIYTYLGDWIDRQRADQKAGVEGADARVAAAAHIKRELEKILEGEPPYDIFVRWKPLHEQAVGWEPDINDGVRMNIRPFMVAKPLNARGRIACILRASPKIKWDKDRGKEPGRTKADFPWFLGWDGQTSDFMGGSEFDGNRWNNLHYSNAVKLAARERFKESNG